MEMLFKLLWWCFLLFLIIIIQCFHLWSLPPKHIWARKKQRKWKSFCSRCLMLTNLSTLEPLWIGKVPSSLSEEWVCSTMATSSKTPWIWAQSTRSSRTIDTTTLRKFSMTFNWSGITAKPITLLTLYIWFDLVDIQDSWEARKVL